VQTTRPGDTVPAHLHRTSAFVLTAALLAACGDAQAGAGRAANLVPGHIQTRVLDTLVSGDNPLLADPIGLYENAAGRFVAVDRSDKMLKVYDADGDYLLSAGRAGPGPGEFGALWGGGPLGDSLFGYDFAKTSVAVFSPEGAYVRSFSVRPPGEGIPAAVLPLDDSLLLVVRFPIDSWRRELISVVRRDGTVRSRFFSRREYFTPEQPPLLQSSYVVADAGNGIVVAGLRGGDSLWVFDYDGRQLAAAPVVVDGRPLRTYRSLIEANRGKMQRPDGSWVIDGVPALTALVVADGGQAVLQVMQPGAADRPWPDLTEGGRFLLARVDRATGGMWMGGDTALAEGLVGKDRAGHPLTYRFVNEQFDALELSRMALTNSPVPGGEK
jgi:hypothetical protein